MSQMLSPFTDDAADPKVIASPRDDVADQMGSRSNIAPRSQPNRTFDHRKCFDNHPIAEFGGGVDNRGRMNANAARGHGISALVSRKICIGTRLYAKRKNRTRSKSTIGDEIWIDPLEKGWGRSMTKNSGHAVHHRVPAV
jgi:hypothetical protein